MKNQKDKTIKKLLLFILDILHEELNDNSNKEKNEQIQNISENDSDEVKQYKDFVDSYQKNYKSGYIKLT